MKTKSTMLLLATFLSLNLLANQSSEISPRIFQIQNAEQEAIFDSSLDFTSKTEGTVEIEFKLSAEINDAQQKEVNELISENVDRIEITFDGLNVKVKLNADLSNAHVWGKIFYSMGITQYTFGISTEQIKQPFDIFTNHFNL